MTNAFRDRTVVVTGAASGIGASVVALLKAEGARVIGVDRRPAPECDRTHVADLGDADAIDALLRALPEGIAGLANVAGLPPTASSDAVLRVNFLGLRRLTLGMVDRLADGAAIVNVASLAGFDWLRHVDEVRRLCDASIDDDLDPLVQELDLAVGGRSYFLSKEALLYWTMANRWTWRDRGIRMNCVSPGPVLTPIHGDFQATLGERAAEDARLMDRVAEPGDIAPIVAFMLSDGSAWIRGANIPADGGMTAQLTLHRIP